ncbi:MAG TPA: rhomboid family intramembrane serine protease [Lentibacillus sp.]|uniref:rhomboid family intramembrane serine protease n=1 Tax=Lentibacillus sp. TaxID=1925746 RepID=UPI002B4AC91B|nr:rhomboid family intramembrane serine protease [Lentibacillus sp.]HLR62403.1 rhomboid family intramembrane serine protease [Lentibacillus sp.]
MYLDESYILYKLACHLTDADDFELIHMSQHEELWLEKREGKTSHVIRLFHGGFDWKNHLKNDIGQVFQKAKAVKRHLRGKHVEIHNIYIAEHAPVDNWDVLKKPMQLNEKNPVKMNVYYLSANEKEEELARLRDAVGTAFRLPDEVLSESDKEEAVLNCKSRLADQLRQKEQELQEVFSYGKPFLTYFLLAVNIFIFLLLELNGKSTSTETLIKFGAKYNPAIIENGEWWRIVTSMFLHIGIFHILMNMLAVYYLGTVVERIYGSFRFLIIYFLAGIGGGLASFAFTTNVSAGASGALFGLFGALLFFGCIHKRIFFQTMGMNLLFIIGINIVFGLIVPQVDNGAHMGGLITGFVASAILFLPKKKNGLIQLSAVILYMLIVPALVVCGVDHNKNSPSYLLMKAEQLISEEQYEEVVDVATKGLQTSNQIEDELESHLLFQRSYAYIELNSIDQAITDLEKSVELNDKFSRAHYNLAVLYGNNGVKDKAVKHINKAYELEPGNEDIEKLYEQLTGNQED